MLSPRLVVRSRVNIQGDNRRLCSPATTDRGIDAFQRLCWGCNSPSPPTPKKGKEKIGKKKPTELWSYFIFLDVCVMRNWSWDKQGGRRPPPSPLSMLAHPELNSNPISKHDRNWAQIWIIWNKITPEGNPENLSLKKREDCNLNLIFCFTVFAYTTTNALHSPIRKDT